MCTLVKQEPITSYPFLKSETYTMKFSTNMTLRRSVEHCNAGTYGALHLLIIPILDIFVVYHFCLSALICPLRRIIGNFLRHALYCDINVPRDLKTMVVFRRSEKVSDHVLEGTVSYIFHKLCQLQRENNIERYRGNYAINYCNFLKDVIAVVDPGFPAWSGGPHRVVLQPVT